MSIGMKWNFEKAFSTFVKTFQCYSFVSVVVSFDLRQRLCLFSSRTHLRRSLYTINKNRLRGRCSTLHYAAHSLPLSHAHRHTHTLKKKSLLFFPWRWIRLLRTSREWYLKLVGSVFISVSLLFRCECYIGLHVTTFTVCTTCCHYSFNLEWVIKYNFIVLFTHQRKQSELSRNRMELRVVNDVVLSF